MCDVLFNKDYNFLVYFELLQTLKCKENSSTSLCKNIQIATSDDEFRDIIWLGIKEYFNKTNNFDTISNIHQQFKHKQLRKTSTFDIRINCNNNNNINKKKIKTNDVFDIQSLTCKILSYLDFKSFMCCNEINKQWLYDSYCPLSISHLNWGDLYVVEKMDNHIDNDGEYRYGMHVRNVSRFSHVKSLTVESEILHNETDLNNFRLAKNFTNIRKLDVNCSISSMGGPRSTVDIVLQIIKNNSHHLELLRISDIFLINDQLELETQMKSLKFPKLIEFNLCNIGHVVNSFCLNLLNNSDNYNYTNCRLAVLKFSNMGTKAYFWRDLADEDCNLSNIKQLVLKSVFFRGNYNKAHESYVDALATDDYVPKIGTKLVNIETLKVVGKTSGVIESKLLSSIVGNRLRHLDINFDDEIAGYIKKKNIKCHFKKLESARITFLVGTDLEQIYHKERY